MDPRLTDFYSSVVRCPNTHLECPGIRNEPHAGWPPRGFYTEAPPEDVRLLLVGKNPGHPISVETAGAYRDLSATQLALKTQELAAQAFDGTIQMQKHDRGSGRFHKRIRSYVSFLLDLPEQEIFRHCAITNLVKCSTFGEQDRLQLKTLENCFSRHFLHEVELYSPVALIAFGREVESFLKKPHIAAQHRRPVFYLKHPSYPYSHAKKTAVLHEIKQALQQFL